MHLGGRKVGGCNCVFMRMRYSRPAQSVPFVSLHYCTIHCIHTLQTAHYKLHTARRALQYCNVGSDCPLCVQPSLSTCMHCRLQIAQMWSRYRAPYFSEFKRTGRHSVQHNSYICTEVNCPVSFHCTAVSITQFAQHCSNLIDQFPFNFQNWENGCLAPKQRISTVKIDS